VKTIHAFAGWALMLLFIIATLPASAQLTPRRSTSALAPEPGTIDVEDMLKQPLRVKIALECPIYYHSTFDRALGSMAPGTIVTLIGLSDTAYRVRGRARHGDVSGWVRPTDVISPDPNMAANLKKMYQRQQQVNQLIDAHQVALGMTTEEVAMSMGKPTRKSSKVTAAGRVDRVEYAVFEKVPQVTMARDQYGQLVQAVVYVKVEVGTLSIGFKDNLVDAIEETKGSPLGGAAVKIVPVPIFFR
jgi:hypothetical protein